MTDRVPLGTRVDEGVIESFREFVRENKDQVKGEMGREVERALQEYMDHDRYSRIEENQYEILTQLEEVTDSLEDGTHAHTNTQGSPTMERTREIAKRLQKEADDTLPAVKEYIVERAITDIAGGDPRTLKKYKRNLQERHLALEHPMEEHVLWWLNGTEFVRFVVEETPQYESEAKQMYGRNWWEDRREELDIVETSNNETEVTENVE